MHFTDSNAHLRVCPMRSDKNTEVYCIGQFCMMWRWGHFDPDHEPNPDPNWEGHCGVGEHPPYY